MARLTALAGVAFLTVACTTASSMRMNAGTSARREAPLPIRELFVTTADSRIHVSIVGEGQTIVMLPPRERGVEDFRDLAQRLAREGYRSVLPQPRGAGASTGKTDGVTMHDLAADVAAVIRSAGGAPVTILGHAFGNRIARMTATDHPSLVHQLILIAAGGKVRGSDETQRALRAGVNPNTPRGERLAALRRAFFAMGNDPSAWDGGWYPNAGRVQGVANVATPVSEWWAGGSVPILLLQGKEDAAAPSENARLLAAEFPNRVTVVEIPGAGHAMLPEQPDRIMSAILAFLRRH